MLNLIQGSFADEVYLKSGKMVRGEIQEENEKFIKGRFEGVDITYDRGDIASVKKTDDQKSVGSEKPLGLSGAFQAKNWWKYTEVDGDGERRETMITSSHRGMEDVDISGVSYKGCSKDTIVQEVTYQDGSRDVGECDVWSADVAGRVREDCVTQKYKPGGQLNESDTSKRQKSLVSAQVDGKVFNNPQGANPEGVLLAKGVTQPKSWWKYTEVDGGERQETTVKLFSRGTVDMSISGASYKDCSKDVVVREIANQDGSHDVEGCTVWSVEGLGRVREDCITQEHEPGGKLKESEGSKRQKYLVSAEIDGKVFNS
jgi:hypothetical protein